MVRTVTATEAKATLLALLDDVQGGDEIEITRHGKPVGRLVPVPGRKPAWGALAGVASSGAEDDELLSTGATWDVS